MDYTIPISELYVDRVASVFPSTTQSRKEDIDNNKLLKPVIVRRVINNENNFINILDDGRHRVFAAHVSQQQEIYAHIKYENNNFDVNKLTPVHNFAFREEKHE
jgi:hypothetical protein